MFKTLMRTAIASAATLATTLVLTCGPAAASTFWATQSYTIPRTSCTVSASVVSHLDSARNLVVQSEGRMPCTGRTASGTTFSIQTYAHWWQSPTSEGWDNPARANWGGNTYGTGQYVYDSSGITFGPGASAWVQAKTVVTFSGSAASLGTSSVWTSWMWCNGSTKTCA